MAWDVNEQSTLFPESPAGENGLNRTLTPGVGICGPGLKASVGAQLGAESGKYISTKIKKFIDKTRDQLETAQRPTPGSFVLGHSLEDFCLWNDES